MTMGHSHHRSHRSHRNKSTQTTTAGWLTSPPWKRTHERRRRRRWCSGSGETLEGRTLLSAMAVAECGSPTQSTAAGSVDSANSVNLVAESGSTGNWLAGTGDPHARPAASRPAVASAPVAGDAVAQRQRYVEVLIFIDSGPLEIGHSDIALTDGRGTTVYGQHGRGKGNGGFAGSAFQRRALDAYLRQEAPSGFNVYVARIEVTEQQFREIRQYLDHKWQNDDDFDLTDDNCSQNVGYVLKKWDLLSKWGGGKNVINDDDFQLPEGDLYNDFIKNDPTWTRRSPGYLSTIPGGGSLYDSVQNKPPTGVKPAGGSSGSSQGGGTSPTSTGSQGGGSGGRSSRLISGMPDDSGGEDGDGEGELAGSDPFEDVASIFDRLLA